MLVLVVWESLVNLFGIKAYLLPAPSRVAEELEGLYKH